MKVELPNYN